MARAGYREVLTSTLSNERGQFFFRKRGYTDCGALLLPGEPLEIILRKELTGRTDPILKNAPRHPPRAAKMISPRRRREERGTDL